MRKILVSLAAMFAVVAFPSFARADEVGDRSAAIQLCRAEIAAQAGASAESVRFDQVRVRLRVVRVDFDLWRNGQLENVRCEVTRGSELQIASITPSLQAVAAR